MHRIYADHSASRTFYIYEYINDCILLHKDLLESEQLLHLPRLLSHIRRERGKGEREGEREGRERGRKGRERERERGKGEREGENEGRERGGEREEYK